MMTATLQQAGRILTLAEAELLNQVSESANQHLSQGNLLASAVVLSQANRIGPLDQLSSFAKPAIDAKSAFEKMRTDFQAKAATAKEELQGSEQPFDSLLVLAEAAAAFKLFPSLRSESIPMLRGVSRDPSLSKLLPPADALVKARVVAASAKPSVKRRASALYRTVIQRFPDTEAELIAQKELAAMDPDASTKSVAMTTEPKTTAMRKWTSKDGDFSVEAKYVQKRIGKVQLQREDGTKIIVDISKLSDEDQAFLREQP